MKRFYSLLALSLGALIATAQIPNYVPTNGLIAFYPLDGNGSNLVGTGNDLTNYNAAGTTDRNGNTGAAMSFNGSNQYLLNSTPSFTFSPTDSFTVSIWYYKPALAGGVAIMFGNTTAGNFIWNLQSGTANQTQFGVNKQQSAWFWAISSYNLNIWEHFVGVYQGGQMTIYKNGAVSGTNTYTHTGAVSATQPLNVGRGISGNYFTGSLDEIAIYNRALSPAEIGLLYAGCGPLVVTQPQNQTQTILSNAIFNMNAASGSSYQWQMNDGSSWSNVSNGGQYSGATTGMLTVSNLTTANNGSEFRCLITNGACLDTSDLATLTVECTALISAQPMDVSDYVNNSTAINIGAQNTGSDFQWQKNFSGVWANVSNGGQYSGANTNSLSISNLTMSNNNDQYRCIISLAGCSDTSAVANLSVSDNSSIDEQMANNFSFHPNPAKNEFTLISDIKLMNENLLIHDISGKEVMRVQILSQEQKVDISALEAGIYLLSVDRYPQTKSKIVVQ